MNRQLTFFDFFSGIGGFRIGLERAGFKCIGYCDNDEYANLLYKNYFDTKEELFFNDITTINTDDLPDFDIFCGGFPCQSFSIAGKRRGFEDSRGTMFFEVTRILRDKRPRYFILENVKGLLNHDGGKTFQTILKILADIGYQTQWQLLNSKFFGVPQNRERVYIVGCYGKECAGKIFPITRTNQQNNCESIKTLYDGHDQLSRIFDNSGISPCLLASRWIQGTIVNSAELKQIPQTSGNAQGSRIYDPSGIGSCLTASGGGWGGKAGLYYVRNGTKKGYDVAKEGDGINLAFPQSKTRRGRVGKGCSQTLDTACNMGTIDGYRVRRLTPLECFRLQGFPDDIVQKARDLGIADGRLYKMAGNAVTVNVVEAVAKRLADAIKK